MSGSKGKENSGTSWQFLRLLQLCTYLVCTLYRHTALCKCQVHWHDFDCEASILGIKIWMICLKITRFKGKCFFLMEEWGCDKNWAHFYKIKWFKNHQKFVLVCNPIFLRDIIFRKINSIFDIEKWSWKSEFRHFCHLCMPPFQNFP